MSRRASVTALSVAVAVVLADSAIVTLALPDILRELGASVGGVAWVLTAFNLVLAVAAAPAARVCVARDPAVAGALGLVAFAAASAGCAVAGSLEVLIGARVAQAIGGAFVIVACLELLVAATGSERRGAARWAAAGVTGAALGPVAGGLLTDAISWQSIFIVQVPVVLAAAPVAVSLRGVDDPAPIEVAPDRPHLIANLALALLSAALTAALFLLVLMLVEGWRRSPAVAAVTVTVIPLGAFAAGALARAARVGTRWEAVAGALLMAGGLVALALPPDASAWWTLAPQALIGLGLGLTVDSLTAVALRDRFPRALHGGWTIAARHGGIVLGLVLLVPVFTADLRAARAPAEEAIAALVLDAPLPASTKLALADGLDRELADEAGRVPDLAPAFAEVERSPAATALERKLDDQLERAATRAFRDAFLVAAALALLALLPALALPSVPGRRAAGFVGLSVVAAAAVLGATAAAGGGDFAPARPADPCAARAAGPVPAALEPLAERIVLTGLDETACALRVTRERLVLDIGTGEPVDPAALQAGLTGGLDRIDPLPPVSALLDEALALTDLPGLAQDAIGAVPDAVVDELLPTRELLERAIAELDVRAILGDLDDPSAIESALRDAILEAAGDQVVDSLGDVL